ncbi:7-carboxy-7-deazaguanine synthase [Umboniibacter marinipuniceus]|uniref:7-carboxy-7-deazaguanine synthase n=1 Tax=Umboniibacter marinipuniceus TaxID=569599 RepID=A0A3L9ZXR1_9GAMM|nr:7-carboxy-7-deazaguanine synthase [Umboniibacter marinipuniceus]RMA77671.1 7-carboxy-7-deazaguanine synthase (Cx14CxxC type) [Umboniibacter marinipuniceus]
MYTVKEMFYTLQGEGAHTGRAAVFLRFTGCNLWSGLEKHRAEAICSFCDTDFVGTDGVNGGKFKTASELAEAVAKLFPGEKNRFVVCTGGEPLLQLDNELVSALRERNFEVAVESNGTIRPPSGGVDWLCISPKGTAEVVVTHCDELKLVFPQADAMPDRFAGIKAQLRYLTPMADPHAGMDEVIYRNTTTQQTIQYCLDHPQWQLNLQSHKVINIA